MQSIIDLYSKFLIAFVGIVTPALALYLNSYFINRTRFEKIIEEQEKLINRLLAIQNKIDSQNSNLVDINLAKESNDQLRQDKIKMEKWKKIVSDLDPKSFFQNNVLLLAISMFFLFLWLIVRSYMNPNSNYCHTLQFITAFTSVSACSIHIYKLYNIGIYLINTRTDVENINSFIKQDEKTKQTEPGQTDLPETE